MTSIFPPGLTQIPSGSSNAFLEIVKGSVPGQSSIAIGAESVDMTNTEFRPVWDAPTALVYPTSAETWEVLSDSANDTSAGTGANAVLIESLDGDFEEQNTGVVSLDGTNPVTLPSTHLRPRDIIVAVAGPGKSNEGTIIVRDQSSGEERLRIRPGLNNSFSSYGTIPAGVAGFVQILNETCPRNDSLRVRVVARPVGGTFQSASIRHVYQNSFNAPIIASPLLPEKTDLVFLAQAGAPNSEISISYQIVTINNNQVPAFDPTIPLNERVIGGLF